MAFIHGPWPALGLALMAPAIAFGQAQGMLPHETLAALVAGSGSASAARLPGDTGPISLRLAPLCTEGFSFASAFAAERPEILVEALYFLPYRSPIGRDEALLLFHKTLRAFSSMQGIQYWSASRNRMHTLFEESWRVSGPSDDGRLPDPTIATIPTAPEAFTIRQKDTTFGANRYSCSIAPSPAGLTMETGNLNGLSLGILPVIGPGKLVTRVLIVPVKEGVYFYVVSGASLSFSLGMGEKMRESFANRAQALCLWFASKAGLSSPAAPR